MSTQPVVVVAGGSPPNTNENSQRPENDATQERALEMAQRYGELTAEYQALQREVVELRGQVEAGRADQTELATLRSELAGLRDQILTLTQAAEPAGPVEQVTPDPEPIEDEQPPPPPKRSWLEIALSI